MAYTKYSLTPADNNAAPPNGAPEGMLPSAVNDTMRDMMAQIRDVGDGIRGGTYTMTAPVITGGSVSGVTAVSTSGNLTFTGTSNRITGDFTNATEASRVAIQTSTTNGNTLINALPNGTATVANFRAYANSNPTNTAFAAIGPAAAGGEVRIQSSITGTGTYIPMTFYTGGSERLRIDTSGNLLLGTTTSPTTTGAAGSMSISGYGIYASLGANGTANTTQNYGISYQNTNLNSTGAANVSLVGLNSTPQASNDATSGTNALILRGVISAPQITSSAATAVLNYAAITGTANRTYSTDTSSSASNTTIALTGNYGHASTLSTSAVSNQAIGAQTNGVFSSGNATLVYGVLNTGSFNPTTGTVSTTSRYGFFDGAIPVGNSTGTATITNWYGIYLNAPNVGANGTITNRWGIYQADPLGTNLLAAPTKISNGYTVATLPTGAAAAVGMKAYVTDALAPVFLTAVVGGGAVVTPVFHNGTTWVAG
jgi:hypothetical protein